MLKIKNWFAGPLVAVALGTAPLLAGDFFIEDNKQMAEPEMKDWSIELGSGVMFNNIRTDDPHNNSTLVPIDLTAELAVDDVSLDDFAGGIFRGYTGFIFRGNYTAVTWGEEDYIAGISVGPRYNFVQPGWKIVPYIGAEVGLAFADSNPRTFPDGGQRGLGQDFNFMFGVEAGARYDINDDFFIRLAALFRHYSNAGLSEPGFQNTPIDAIGPVLSFGVRF